MRSPGSWGHRHGLPQLSLVSPFPSTPPLCLCPLQVILPWMHLLDGGGGLAWLGHCVTLFCNTPYVPSLPSQLFHSLVSHLGLG